MRTRVGTTIFLYRINYLSTSRRDSHCKCDFPELRKLLRKYEVGREFDPSSPRSIANAIRFCLADPARYERMRVNIQEALLEYNWENETAKLLEVYRSLDRQGRQPEERVEKH